MTGHVPDRYIRGTCPVCGAQTEEEAENRCQVARDITDEYYCVGGSVESGLFGVPSDGGLYFFNPKFDEWAEIQIGDSGEIGQLIAKGPGDEPASPA